MNTHNPRDSSKKETQKPNAAPSQKKGEAPSNGVSGKNRKDFIKHNSFNTEQLIVYLLLIIGLLLLLFVNNLLGGLIIGMVTGYYFASEIFSYARNIGQIIKGQDQLRYIVFTAVLFGLFIAAPGIFIGAAVVAAFKQLVIKPQ